MFRKTQVCSGVLIALSGALLAPHAFAQSQSAERVEITGSRIRSIAADSPTPVQVISGADIAQSGVVNLQDLLLKNPTMGSPAISRTNSNFSTSSAGVATLDLRNLGTSRTLVLVNGRRVVSGVPGEQAVDMNTIPTEFIERVELLTGGASALYGSDAVAGVVNIILKKNFDGFAAEGQIGRSAEGDDEKRKLSLTFGSSTSRTSLMGHLAYSDQGAVFSADRSRSAVDQISRGTRGAVATRDPNLVFAPQVPFFSGFNPQGTFYTDNNVFSYNRAGAVVPDNTNGAGGAEPTGFNRSEFRSIAIPTERFLLGAKAEHAITDSHSIFFEGTYAQTQTKTRLEPFPLASDDIFPANGGQVPAGAIVGGVLLRNPLVPDHIWNDISDTNGDGVPDYFFTRRLSEVGNRGNVADRDTFRFSTGLRGDITSKIQYDTFVSFGSTKEAQVSSGQVNVLNFRNALTAHADVNDFDSDGNITEAVCADANARAQSCVPINVFGHNSISADALRYVTAPGLLATYTSQRVAGASVSGELIQLPAGPLGFAAGVEYREEFSRSEFDPLQQAGLNAGNAIPRTEGEFDVTDYFMEARIPLLKGIPGVHSLATSLAVRSGKYSTVGNTTSWNANLDWAITRSLRFRATQSVSTRAPNINELFSPPSQTFPTGLSDPCVGVTTTSVGTRDDRCRVAPGVLANINANGGTFVSTQADQQGVSGFDRGNPTLGSEKGKSFTAGIVFSPLGGMLENLTVSLDYFKIEIDDAIVSTPRSFILSQCYTGDTSFCRFIQRRASQAGPASAGSIAFIDSAVTNSGGLGTEGVDVSLGYSTRVGAGTGTGRLSYTRLIDGYNIPLRGSPENPFAGEVGASKDRFTLDLGYNVGAFGAKSTVTYVGKAALDDQFIRTNFGGRVAAGSITVPAKTYVDFQLSYNIRKQAQLYFGVDNAFDVEPPPIISGLTGNVTGTETDAGTYDAIGQRFYAGVRLKF